MRREDYPKRMIASMNIYRCHFFRALLCCALLLSFFTIAVQAAVAFTPDHAKYLQSETDGLIIEPISRQLTVVSGLNGVQFRPEQSDAVPRLLPPGAVMRATARTEDGQWLYVEADGETSWVATDDVVVFGLDAIPVQEPAPGTILTSDRSLDTPSANSSAQSAQNTQRAQSTQGDNATTASTSTSPASTASADESSTLADTSPVERATVTAGRLNVRSGAGVENERIAQVSQGDELVILGRNADGRWLLVELPSIDGTQNSNQVGWVSARFTQLGNGGSSFSVASTQGGSALGRGASASPAGLSGTLAFQQRIGGAIYIYDLGSGSLRQLTTGSEPALSPDGRTVAFTRSDGLYLAAVDGSNERLIFSGREGLGSPKWSPDGETIIFTRGDEWQSCVKWGGVKESCTESSQVGEGKYKKIMYAIAAVDVNGGSYRDVVSTKPARAPDWTSAGIVYQSIDGLQLTQVDRDAVNTLIDYDYLDPFYYDPDWQPGGNQIVFESKEGSHWQIFSINSDGSNRHALTKPRTALVDQLPSSVAPAFSPDGQHIVYLSNIESNGEAGDWRLWVMNADGSNQRPLPINIVFEYTHGVEQVVSWQ